MIRNLLLVLVLNFSILHSSAQQAEVVGNCLFNNTNNTITIRLAIRNSTNSNVNVQYVGQRWGMQFNSSAVTYTGFFSHAYLGTNQTTGLNDASSLSCIGGDTGPFPAIGTESPSSRVASITGGGTKTLQRRYINLSTDVCDNAIIIEPNQTVVVLDIYFTLNNPALAAYYNLNNPTYGFNTPDFIAQFFTKNNGGHNGVLESVKKEIAITIIRQGNESNPYQPFDMSNCSNGNVNPVTVGGDGIYFNNPQDGVLAGTVKSANVQERSGFAEVSWQADNNQFIDHFEIERKESNGQFKTIALVMGDNSSLTKQYNYRDKLTGFEALLQYRVKVVNTDGSLYYSSIASLNLTKITDLEVKFTPNPVASMAQLNLPLVNESYICRIYNTDGRMVMTVQLKGRAQTLNLEQLRQGNYFMEAFHPQTGKRFYGKFTKQ
jgi:hypothetical protein